MTSDSAGERGPREEPSPDLLEAVRGRLRSLAVQVDKDRWQAAPKREETPFPPAGPEKPEDHAPLSLPEAVRDRVREIAARLGEDQRSLTETRLAREAELEQLRAENARLRQEHERSEAGWREEKARLEDGYRRSLKSLESRRDEYVSAALDELERLLLRMKQIGVTSRAQPSRTSQTQG